MIIQRFAFWNPGTWQIPKLYWDAFSDEQRIHAICKQLGKVIAYADYLGINVDDIAERLKAIEEGQLDPIIIAAIEQWFEDNQPAIMTALQNLNDALPIADFDSVNTVKAAIDAVENDVTAIGYDVDALEGKFPIQTADIADNAVTSTKIANDAITMDKLSDPVIDVLHTMQGQFDISPILLGCVVYSKQNNMYDHPGSICTVGDTQYLFSSPQTQTNNAGHARAISIVNNTDNWSQYQTLSVGHSNSAAYHDTENMIYLAPVFDYSGGTGVAADYISKFAPGSTVVTNIQTPEWIMAVSFDSVTGKLYALAYSGMIYEVNGSTFTEVKQIRRNSDYNQDFAIHDGLFCVSSTRGNMFTGTLSDDWQALVNVNHTDASFAFIYGELDGMEFDHDGHLLAIAHTNQLDDRPTLIYEIPIFDTVTPLYDYAITPEWAVGTYYSLRINQNSTVLRADGIGSGNGLKSINFLNMLADTTQRSLILEADYTCDNLRIGNDAFNWISLGGYTLRVTDTCTIQTPVIFNGSGTLRVNKPISISFGIPRLGFEGNIALVVDTQSYLLAQRPAGCFVSFGTLDTAHSTANLKLNSSAGQNIAASQVYILGTVLNS